jgi:hypothetical protein
MAGAAETSDPTKAPGVALQRAWADIRRSREQVNLRMGVNDSSGSTKRVLHEHAAFSFHPPTALRIGPVPSLACL